VPYFGLFLPDFGEEDLGTLLCCAPIPPFLGNYVCVCVCLCFIMTLFKHPSFPSFHLCLILPSLLYALV
jgi:hypothetical protein